MFKQYILEWIVLLGWNVIRWTRWSNFLQHLQEFPDDIRNGIYRTIELFRELSDGEFEYPITTDRSAIFYTSIIRARNIHHAPWKVHIEKDDRGKMLAGNKIMPVYFAAIHEEGLWKWGNRREDSVHLMTAEGVVATKVNGKLSGHSNYAPRENSIVETSESASDVTRCLMRFPLIRNAVEASANW